MWFFSWLAGRFSQIQLTQNKEKNRHGLIHKKINTFLTFSYNLQHATWITLPLFKSCCEHTQNLRQAFLFPVHDLTWDAYCVWHRYYYVMTFNKNNKNLTRWWNEIYLFVLNVHFHCCLHSSGLLPSFWKENKKEKFQYTILHR